MLNTDGLGMPPDGTAMVIVNNAIAAYRHSANSSREDTAIDIWPFVIGVDSEAAPSHLPPFELGSTSPIRVEEKRHLACRFCSP